MQVELTQVKAMLQEICVATKYDSYATQAIMKIGTGKTDWDKLEHIDELADVVLATRRALPEAKEGKITFDAPVWQKLEDIYYQRVVKPIFAD